MYRFRKYLKNKFYATNKYIKEGFYRVVSNLFPPCRDKLVQWLRPKENGGTVDGELIDFIGDWNPEFRVGGVYLASGTIDTGLVSTALTYVDAVTGLEIADITDGSGNFVVPVNGIKYFTIDGNFFPCEENVGSYIGATNAEYYEVTSATWDISDALPSYADENGYTPANGSTHYWDPETEILISTGAIIPFGAGFIGDPPENLFDQSKWVEGGFPSPNTEVFADRFIVYQASGGSVNGVNYPNVEVKLALENFTTYDITVTILSTNNDGATLRTRNEITGSFLIFNETPSEQTQQFTTGDIVSSTAPLYMYVQDGTNDVSFFEVQVKVVKA